jgi:hypothetical protein
MAEFDSVSVVLTTASGAVPDVTVRFRGKQDFVMNAAAPSGGNANVAPSQPFSMDPSTVDPSNPGFRVAKLKFAQAAIGAGPGSWHKDAFDPRLALVQVMDVKGVGPKDLKINLSCTEHPNAIAVNGASEPMRNALPGGHDMDASNS